MPITRAAILLAALAALIAPAAHAQPAGQGAPARLVIAYVPASSFLPAFVAKDSGAFARHGLDVTLTPIALMPNIPPVLLSGAAQIGSATGPGFLQAVGGGIDLVAIAGAARQSPEHCTTSLVAAADSGITGVQSLRDRRIGIPGLLSISDLVFRAWLAAHSMGPSDMVFIEVPLAQERDLLRTHQIDAALAVEPVRARLLEGGGAIRVADYPVEVKPDLLYSFWMAPRPWADAHGTEIQRLRAALNEAIAEIGPAGAADIEKKYLGINAQVRPIYDTAITPADLRFFQTLLANQSLPGTDADPATLIVKD